jgi:hypothetical protein
VGQILAMAGIGIVGSFSKKLLKNETSYYRIGMAGGLGFLCALWYDGITTLAYPISAGYTWNETMAYAISVLLFTFMHLISNTVIFSVVVPGYLKRLSK